LRVFAELKRRNVIRMAGLYLVGAWLLIQIAETLLPIFHTPEWVLQALVVLLALGLLPALVFSWVYELTPDGLKRDVGVTAEPRFAATTGRRMDRLIFAGLIVLIGLIAADRFWPQGAESTLAPSVDTNGEESLAKVDPDPGLPTADPIDPADRRSIAVLPFVNMSPDADNEFFADGISEELLNILAGIDGLKVASRTSAFSFKGKDTSIPEIARLLDVHHVLEGSVRKQGNRVKITAQLIEAGSDAHLWTQTYQRDLDDIFLVQEEIAIAITTALQDILGTREVKVDAPTTDMAAYQRYLHGRSRFYQRFELDQAIDDLRFAVERDPQFAEAWAFLAATYWLVGYTSYASGHDRSEMSRLAGPAVDRAMSLKSDMPIAVALKGRLIIDSDAQDRVADGIGLMQRAVTLSASDTTPRLWLALIWLELGYVERALPLLESARRQDPLVGINHGALGVAQAIEGRRVEAVALVLQAVELDGLAVWATILATDTVHAGDRAGAAELIAAMLPLFSDRFASDRSRAAGLLEVLQNPALEQAYLKQQLQLTEDMVSDIYTLGPSLMFERGASAFVLVDSGRAKTWPIINSAWLPAMRWLREDPRYFGLMATNGRVEYWDNHGYPRGCRPVDGPDGRHLSCPEQP
jgi:TolB-like protein